MDSFPAYRILSLVQPTENPSDCIDIEKIRSITMQGLDNCPPEDRCMAWLVLLGIFPRNPREWPQKRKSLMSIYGEYVKMLGLSDWHTKHIASITQVDRLDISNKKLIDSIRKDLARSGRHIFTLPIAPIENDQPPEESNLFLYEAHLRRLERILYVLGSVNQAMGYMQGFNELLIPFYCVLFSSISIFSGEFEVEGLSFHCLHQLLFSSDLQQLYTTDDKSSIIMMRINPFNEIVEKHIPRTADLLKRLEISPLYYSFKWFCLLFSQNYEMPVVHQIWDVLFAHFDSLVDYSFYIGCAQMKMIEGIIYDTDFSTTVSSLQNIVINDVCTLLRIAQRWWEDDHSHSALSKMRSAWNSFANGVVSKSNKK